MRNKLILYFLIFCFREMYENFIEVISVGHLIGMKKLDTLDLSHNKIHTLNLQDLENSKELVTV